MPHNPIFDHEDFRSMHITVTLLEGLGIIALQGRFLGDHDADNFCDAIKDCLAGGTRKIIIDLAGVDYINSMGLGALIAGFILAKNETGRLVYANPNASIKSLLHLTKTDRSVPVFDTLDEAKAAFA